MNQLEKIGLYLMLGALFVQGVDVIIIPLMVPSILLTVGGLIFLWPKKELS